MHISRLCRNYWLKFRRLQGSPKAIAGGAAVGIFVGLTPTLPFQPPLILLLTTVPRTSFAAAILSSWVICNPVTMVPLYYLAFVCGRFFAGDALNAFQPEDILVSVDGNTSYTEVIATLGQLGSHATLALIIGSLLYAIPFGAVSYLPLLRYTRLFQRAKKKRSKMIPDTATKN